MRERRVETERRLVALGVGGAAILNLPDQAAPLPYSAYLSDIQGAGTQLTESCIHVFDGSKIHRVPCRALDVLVYGGELANRGPAVGALLSD